MSFNSDKAAADVFTLVAEFQKAFETSEDVSLWTKLVKEELAELEEAIELAPDENQTPEDVVPILKEWCDLMYVMSGLANVMDKLEAVPSEGSDFEHLMINATITLTQIGDAFGEVYGEEALFEAFKRVHESNMSKLGDDGKPVRREDGKILKGPNYKAPDLLDLVKE